MTKSRSHAATEDSIAAALDRLRAELAVVREILDEIRDELQWTNRNRGESDRCSRMPLRITSMPLDPAALDWEINRFSAADLPAEVRDPTPRQQGQLF